MSLVNRLWLRVFAYSLILVLAAGAIGIHLVRGNLTAKASAVVLTFTGELRAALKGQSPREAHAFLNRFNTQEARFWLEDDRGEIIAGQRYAGKSGADWIPNLSSLQHSGDTMLWKTNLKNPLFLAIVPCELRGGKATLYAAYMAFPVPPLETLLSPGIATLALITGLLALWIAVKVGRPLRQLRREVADISGNPPRLRNVGVTGSDEIAEVARAINRLVDSLRSHIDGMNQLVVNISHELRSPITRMGLSVEMIGEGLALLKKLDINGNERDKTVARLAESNFMALRQELDHMNRLIGDTLLTSRLELRDPAELTESVSLSELCANAAERHDPMFRQAGIRFMRGMERDITVTGDATLLTQVLSNLLDNAVKYATGDDPLARLRLFRDGDQAVIAVENTYSPALPQDVLEHLFDPYFRYNQQISTGVGMGLAILKKTAVLHRGFVRAENTAMGVMFSVILPLRQD